MDRDRVLDILRKHEAELKASGVAHLSLFGSVARGDASTSSDVDLLAEWIPDRSRSLLDVGGVHTDVADWLGIAVDIADKDRLRPEFRENILREAILVF